MLETPLVDEVWLAALEDAYMCARGKRSAELQGKKPSEWSFEGLHAFSAAMGRVLACQRIEHALACAWFTGGVGDDDPFINYARIVREGAKADAEAEHRESLKLDMLAKGEIAA